MTITPEAPVLPVPVDYNEAATKPVSLTRVTPRKRRPFFGDLDVTTGQAELLAALEFTKRDQNTRAPLQILLGALLEATDDGLTVSRFDYEQANSETINAAGTGRALVPAAALRDFVKALDKGPLTLKVARKTRHLVIAQEDLEYTLPLMELANFPALPQRGDRIVTALSGTELHGWLRVLTAAGKDDTLPVLTCAQLSTEDSTLTVAATDRYRLTVLETELPASTLPPLLVPAKALHNLAVALKGEAEVVISVRWMQEPVPLHKSYRSVRDKATGEYVRKYYPTPRKPASIDHITFRSASRTITLRLVEGEFPMWRRLLPEASSFTARLTAPVKAFTRTINQVAIAAERNSPVRFDLSDTARTLTAGQPGSGDQSSACKRLSDTEFTGESLTIAANPGFLLDGIKACGGDMVTLDLVTSTKPFILSSPDNPTFRYLLMPVRISG